MFPREKTYFSRQSYGEHLWVYWIFSLSVEEDNSILLDFKVGTNDQFTCQLQAVCSAL